jgi:creatinine amidohydrolase
MKWQELKWPAVRQLNKDLPVVVPLGSIEQHGWHLPLCTDTTQVASIVEGVGEKLRDSALFLPVLWLGSSHHHLDFPGTLSIRPSLYSQVVQELANSVLSAGFRRLFFLNGHGGNETPAAQALAELAATDPLAKQSLLAMASWWSVGKPDAKRHNLDTAAISHACEYETSLMLWLRPKLVDLQFARDASLGLENSWLNGEKRVALFRRFSAMTASGSLGKPSVASAEKGKSILDAVVEDVVAFVQAFAEWPLPTEMGPIEKPR